MNVAADAGVQSTEHLAFIDSDGKNKTSGRFLMNNYTREDILRIVEEEDVGFIRLQFTDMYGT